MIAALAIAALSAFPAPLDVPYLPQTNALCGGAAAAMVFRYWGDAHADPQEFAPLVDRRAGGIANDVLVDAVRRRGWQAAPGSGSPDALAAPLAAGRPVIVLLEDRRARYHYVVVTGETANSLTVHDPSVGPARTLGRQEFERRWRATDYWALVVLPPAVGFRQGADTQVRPYDADGVPTNVGAGLRAGHEATCDALLARALDDVRANGFESADATLARVRADCPADPGPWRELAGVRFAEHRWSDAASLAREALTRDPHDAYALDLLGSSLFMQDDDLGALRAWNQIGRPRVNLVRIEGLRHARYQTVAEALALRANMLLTVDAFERARRRLDELPNRLTARLALRPEQDGFATVDVVVVERSGVPQNRMEWAAAGLHAAVEHEAAVAAPGPTGAGEVWSAKWRWWENRPGVAFGFTAPRTGALPGVWRVDASWDQESYASGASVTRQSHVGGALTFSDWLTGTTRYSVGASVDRWNDAGRTASGHATIDRYFAHDRIAVSADAQKWIADGGPGFHSIGARVHLSSAAAAEGWTAYGTVGVQHVGDAAPLVLWPGAGEGRVRTALARAHPMLDHGVIDLSGRALLGRSLVDATVEAQRWLAHPRLAHVAVAGFMDSAHVSRRALDVGPVTQVDLGAGLRVRIPGVRGMLRLDAARGLFDHAQALTVGWQY